MKAVLIAILTAVALAGGVVLAPDCLAAGGRGLKRGKPCSAPRANLKKVIIWGAECEKPEGRGLAFGGQHQRAEDGRPHTRVKEAGAWKAIHEALRAKNPLQKHHAKTWALRTELKNALARARHVYFEGLTERQELAFLGKEVNPRLLKLSRDLAALMEELGAQRAGGEYEAGQVKFAAKHLAAAAVTARPPAGPTTPEMLKALRRAQVELEIAAEAFDAEPPPRVVSPIVYDAKTRLYVIFAGDHFDYLTNDTWVFDPAKKRWFQRHPEGAPHPRGNHRMTASGDGKVVVRGGYVYLDDTKYMKPKYRKVGGGQWTYSLEKNAWTSASNEGKLPAEARVYRSNPYVPEYYMRGPRPDAAAQAARLKALPANTWVNTRVPHRLQLERGWGTIAYDSHRDMILLWGGGHCWHGGTDVPHYHLATNRWELPFPVEFPLGQLFENTKYPGGFNFNRRPWSASHAFMSYAYDATLRKLVLVGRHTGWGYGHDPYSYLYDPDVADWTARHRKPKEIDYPNHAIHIKVCRTPKGVVVSTGPGGGGGIYRFDNATLKWTRLKVKGKLPHSNIAYDPKRDRCLFVRSEKKIGIQIRALDMKTLEVETLSPKGMRKATSSRDTAYYPEADLILFAATVRRDLSRTVAYDCAKNRWVSLKIGGVIKPGKWGKYVPYGPSRNYNTGLCYDSRRKLFWAVDTQSSKVFVLRLDLKTADLKPLE